MKLWMYSESLESSRERLTQPQLCILHVQVLFEFFYHDDNDYDFFVFFMQDEKELCLATAQFEDFVLQFMDRWVTLFFKISSVIQYMYMQVPIGTSFSQVKVASGGYSPSCEVAR